MEVVNWIFNFVLGFVKWTFVFIVAHVWTGWFVIGLIVAFISIFWFNNHITKDNSDYYNLLAGRNEWK